MRILILGSGGREHTLSWKLASELGRENIFIAPGNGGTMQCGTNVKLAMDDFDSIKDFCIENKIDVLLPGSEDPIANGIRNSVEADQRCKNIYVFSPDQYAAQLESSKTFAKEFMFRHNIPTAGYQSFKAEQLEDGFVFLESLKPPFVLKADGLAAGKGVLIIDELKEAKQSLKEMLVDSKFGEASSSVVIEEFLDGIEFSVFALTDGENYVLLPEAKDYKRIGEADTGLNTGGMGAVSPVPFFTAEIKEKTIKEVVEPTIAGLKKDGYNYRGFVFFGLINVEGTPKVIEYNVRMGDPETEVVIPRLAESLSAMIDKSRKGELLSYEAKQKAGYCTTVFSVSGGYPEQYEKGKEISIPERETLFHAGTKFENGKLLSAGGRVLAATEFGSTLEEALNLSYATTAQIRFEKQVYRRDIGMDLKSMERNGST